MTDSKKNIVVAISGGGRTLKNLITQTDAPSCPYKIKAVISSKKDIAGNRIAEENGLPLFLGKFSKSHYEETATQLSHWLDGIQPDLIALAGFLSPFPLNHSFADRVVNIHPALLPLHGGRGMYGIHVHKSVIAAGDSETGATVHKVTPNYDEGKILGQIRLAVTTSDPDQLAKAVFEAECLLYPEVISKICAQKPTNLNLLKPIGMQYEP